MSHIKYVVGQFTSKGYVKQNSSASLSRLRTGKTPPLKAYTDNLIGCLATVVYVEQLHDTHAHLAHFAPSTDCNEEHQQHLLSFLQSKELKNPPLSKVHFIIAVPGNYKSPDSQEIQYPEDFYPRLIDNLHTCLLKELKPTIAKNGTSFSWRCVPYGDTPPIGKSHYCADVEVVLNQMSTCTISSLGMNQKIEL
jgi:hypothetical protein